MARSEACQFPKYRKTQTNRRETRGRGEAMEKIAGVEFEHILVLTKPFCA